MDRPKCPKCIEHKWPDPQEPVEGSEFCVFHAPIEEKGCSTDAFNTLIFDRIRYFSDIDDSSATQCRLTGTIFPGDISFTKFGKKFPPIWFDYSIFSGVVNFSSTRFHKLTSFYQVHFKGEVDFTDSFFGHPIDTYIIEHIDFSESIFEKSAIFHSCLFNCISDFYDTKFIGTVSFLDLRVFSYISFHESIFMNDVEFLSLIINGILSFNSVQFIKNINFTTTSGASNSILMINIEKQYLENVKFKARESTQFSFRSCIFPEKLYIENETNPDFQSCMELYRCLKQKAAAEHDQPLVSKWHYREKLMALKQLKKKRGWLYIFSMTWLYHTFSGFGEKPKWAWWWLFGVIFLPLFVLAAVAAFETTPELVFNAKRAAQVVTDWLRFIPFIKQEPATTDGTFPGALGLALSSAWQLLIALQAALFGLALRNKFRR